MNLKYKFMTIFMSIAIIPIIIISTYTYNRYTDLISRQMNLLAINVEDSVSRDTNNVIDNINKMDEAFLMYSDYGYSIINDLKRYVKADGSYTTYDLFMSRNNMRFLCQHLMLTNQFVNGIFIFTPSGENIGYGYGGNIDIVTGYKPFDDDWYKETVANAGRIYISDASKKSYIIASAPSVTFSRALYDVYTKQFLGVLVIDCKPEIFNTTNANILPDISSLSIAKDSGSVLFTTSTINSNQQQKQSFLSRLGSNIVGNATSQTITHSMDNIGLKIVITMDYQNLFKQFGYTKILIVVISVVCAIVFILISILLSSSLTRPITYLSKIMSNHSIKAIAGADRFINRKDEIGILYNEYNSMMEQLKSYIKEQYQNKLITMDAQMRALEAQINSHFLYNTLESINSIAELEEVNSISIMSLALGNMFRYAIKTKSELVSVSDELEHVSNYVAIQRIRYDDQIQFVINVDKDLYSVQVLKLILQPVVENALYHGIAGKGNKGIVTLSAQKDNQDILFQISDDGVGLSPSKLAEINSVLSEPPLFKELGQRTHQSIGLKNIHSRIELYYGRGYGLTLQSEEGKFTTVTIRIPYINKEVANDV